MGCHLIANHLAIQVIIHPPQEPQRASFCHSHIYRHKRFLDVRCQCKGILLESEEHSYHVCRPNQYLWKLFILRVALEPLNPVEHENNLLRPLGIHDDVVRRMPSRPVELSQLLISDHLSVDLTYILLYCI